VITRDALPFVKTVGVRSGAKIFGIFWVYAVSFQSESKHGTSRFCNKKDFIPEMAFDGFLPNENATVLNKCRYGKQITGQLSAEKK